MIASIARANGSSSSARRNTDSMTAALFYFFLINREQDRHWSLGSNGPVAARKHNTCAIVQTNPIFAVKRCASGVNLIFFASLSSQWDAYGNKVSVTHTRAGTDTFTCQGTNWERLYFFLSPGKSRSWGQYSREGTIQKRAVIVRVQRRPKKPCLLWEFFCIFYSWSFVPQCQCLTTPETQHGWTRTCST